ncbi:SEC-C domain-containing protein [Fredinandcohnia humi]
MIYTGNSKNLKIDPYEECPCDSGKKFKFCCYQEARKVKHNGYKTPDYSDSRINHMVHKTWEDTDFKVCLGFEKENCNGDIKNAHSLQNNRILNRISVNNHLYKFSFKVNKTGPVGYFQKISKNKASAFFGFCDYHDTELFKPIELHDYDNTELQNFLFAFRSHSLEYHLKLRKLEMQKEVFKLNPSMMLDESGVYVYKVAKLDVEDCAKNHEMFKIDYLNGDYSKIKTIHRKLDYEVPFATCTSFAVNKDLNGNIINDIYSTDEEDMPSVYLNVYPIENGTNIIISYHENDERFYKTYFTQLEQLDNDELTEYMNFLIIEYTENVFFNIDFIENLESKSKESLLESFQSSVNLLMKFDLIDTGNYYNFNLFQDVDQSSVSL